MKDLNLDNIPDIHTLNLDVYNKLLEYFNEFIENTISIAEDIVYQKFINNIKDENNDWIDEYMIDFFTNYFVSYFVNCFLSSYIYIYIYIKYYIDLYVYIYIYIYIINMG